SLQENAAPAHAGTAARTVSYELPHVRAQAYPVKFGTSRYHTVGPPALPQVTGSSDCCVASRVSRSALDGSDPTALAFAQSSFGGGAAATDAAYASAATAAKIPTRMVPPSFRPCDGRTQLRG